MGIEKKIYSFRFSQDMIDKLQTYATKENRSLSNIVETILKEYLRKKKKASQK